MTRGIARAALGGFVMLLGLVITGFALDRMWDERITRDYATLADARADRLFARGWLPDILPPSSHDIRTSTDLDSNTSRGRFAFAPHDFQGFWSLTRSPESLYVAGERLEVNDAEMRKRGFSLGVFAEDDSVWVFFCRSDEGYCEYQMWYVR